MPAHGYVVTCGSEKPRHVSSWKEGLRYVHARTGTCKCRIRAAKESDPAAPARRKGRRARHRRKSKV